MKRKPLIDLKRLGKNLKNAREGAGISQSELVKEISDTYGVGWTTATISRWETGKVLMDLDNLVIYSEYFNIPIEQLIYN
jgi:DNA-binding helix-turn-helix protein